VTYDFWIRHADFIHLFLCVSSLFVYTLSEAWSGVSYWADLMAVQGAFWDRFFDRSTRTIVGTMLWTEYIDLS